MKTILYVDDDLRDSDAVRSILFGHRVHLVRDGRRGLEEICRREPDLIILDIMLPDMSGIEILDRMAAWGRPLPPVIALSGLTDPAVRKELRRRGVVRFLLKPVERASLQRSVNEVLYGKAGGAATGCEASAAYSPAAGAGSDPDAAASPVSPSWDAIKGSGEAIRLLKAKVRRYAVSGVPVLITGESGTGKELFAGALHEFSGRSGRPFVPVNCAALPETLAESELFGTAAGAYTGAVSRPGLFERAHGGTLFLDEIGELSPAVQAKLLRVLETGMVDRLGSSRRRKVNVQLISATNRTVSGGLRQAAFRKDLYFRIARLELHLPPLRCRSGDIEEIAHSFLRECGVCGLSSDALRVLRGYEWPGNVRELQLVLQRAVINLGEEGLILPEHLELPDYYIRPPGDGQMLLF
jgi:DNA-binding NtrC family response regulator